MLKTEMSEREVEVRVAEIVEGAMAPKGLASLDKTRMDIELGQYEYVADPAGKPIRCIGHIGRAEADYIRISTKDGWWWITTSGDTLEVGIHPRLGGKVVTVDHLDPKNGQT